MGQIKRKKDGEFDFGKLPKGVYFFSGQEGFVKVEVDKKQVDKAFKAIGRSKHDNLDKFK